MTEPDVAALAAGLTKAQARRAAFDEIAEAGADGLGFGRSALLKRRELLDRGLIERLPSRGAWQPVRERLTPLGLAVRQHLLSVQQSERGE